MKKQDTNRRHDHRDLVMLVATLMIIICPIVVSAQTPSDKKVGQIHGILLESAGTPVEFANVVLKTVNETAQLVRGAVTDVEGVFSLERIPLGVYMMEITAVGYETIEKKIQINSTDLLELGTITIKESSEMLEGVDVVYHRKFVEQKIDRTVINVAASPSSAGENLLETLKKVPGVSVDADDNISLKGKSGVLVLIDDRPTYMTGTQLATLLKSTQSSSVEKIEVIDTPPARYDAEGNAGIINIRTKRIRLSGMNGNAGTHVRYRTEIENHNWVNLNYQNDNVNIYGGMDAGFNGRDRSFELTRYVDDANGNPLMEMIQNARNPFKWKGGGMNVGLDYFHNRTHTFGMLVRSNIGWTEGGTTGPTRFISRPSVNDEWVEDSISQSTNDWNDHHYNVTANLNYLWKIDTLGSSLNMDVDYVTAENQQIATLMSSTTVTASEEESKRFEWTDHRGYEINILSGKVDYTKMFLNQSKLEAGVKSSYVHKENPYSMSNYENSDWVPQDGQGDNFIYDESNSALYASYSTAFGQTGVQVGLRGELTWWHLNSLSTGVEIDSTYFRLFPTLFVQQPLNAKNALRLGYSYRITRPNYENLNPFRWYIDPYTYEVGNPYLQPQFTHSVNLTHAWNNMVFSTLGYSHTAGAISQLIDVVDPSSMSAAVLQANLDDVTNITLSESVQIPFARWWNMNWNTIGVYNITRTHIYTGEVEELKALYAQTRMQHSFFLPKDYTLELTGVYVTPFNEGLLHVDQLWEVDFGVQKKVLKGKGTISFAVTDIFGSMGKQRVTADYGAVDMQQLNQNYSRDFKLSFSYNFGNKSLKASRTRTTASEEEMNRISQ